MTIEPDTLKQILKTEEEKLNSENDELNSERILFIKCSHCGAKREIDKVKNLHEKINLKFRCRCELIEYSFSPLKDLTYDLPIETLSEIEYKKDTIILKIGSKDKDTYEESYKQFIVHDTKIYLKTTFRKLCICEPCDNINNIYKKVMSYINNELFEKIRFVLAIIAVIIIVVCLYNDANDARDMFFYKTSIIDYSDNPNSCFNKIETSCWSIPFFPTKFCTRKNQGQCSIDNHCGVGLFCETNTCSCEKKCTTSKDCNSIEEKNFCSNNVCTNMTTYINDYLQKNVYQKIYKEFDFSYYVFIMSFILLLLVNIKANFVDFVEFLKKQK